MDYKNDNRTPRDRITGEFLSELLFTDLGGECDCERRSMATNATVTETPSRRSVNGRSGGCCTADRSLSRVNMERHSACGRSGVEITGDYSLAMAYVPMQSFGELFDIEEGFCQGTIFRELRFPFYPTPCRKEAD